jgi:putative tryptophan/tyrosine transport system substrate-binding protein
MAIHIRRREFIVALSSAAFGRPLAARAQQPSLPKIGVLCSKSPSEEARLLARFRQGLNEIGYVEGHNVAIEYRWANDQNDRLTELVADLVRRQVTVIATPGSHPATLAAKAATTTIPIVFTTSGDPVQLGLVSSMSRPGSNMTGVTSMGVELGPKQLEVLHELIPTATTMALLINPGSPANSCRRQRARSGSMSRSYMRAPNSTSTRSLQPSFSEQADS